MLVLTRKKGDAIVIGDNIKIVVLSVSGESVKIGVEAPSHVKILRAELLEAVKDINVTASKKLPHMKTKRGGKQLSPLSELTIKAKRKND